MGEIDEGVYAAAEEEEVELYGKEGRLRLPVWMRVGLKVDQLLRSHSRRRDGGINRRLLRLLDCTSSACRHHPLPHPPARNKTSLIVCSKDVVINPLTGVWVRIYHHPSSSRERSVPIIFYFHGGGFVELCANLLFYDSFCKWLSKACKVVVISVNYRLAPEHRYPTAYEDCFSALKWANNISSSQHIPPIANPNSCFLMGDSAGGNIVHHVACMASSSPSKDYCSSLQIKGSFLLFPFFGGEEKTPAEIRMPSVPFGTIEEADWFWRAYLPLGATKDHFACNVTGPNSIDYTKLALPPCMVVVAEHDFLKDWQLKLVKKLKDSGKKVSLEYYKGGFHCFHIFKHLKISQDLMTKVENFIKEMNNEITL